MIKSEWQGAMNPACTSDLACKGGGKRGLTLENLEWSTEEYVEYVGWYVECVKVAESMKSEGRAGLA